MSLINQMLRDLESRRALDERGSLPNEVRPLPEERSSALPRVAALAGLVVMLAGAGWWLTRAIRPAAPLPAVTAAPRSAAVHPPARRAQAPASNSGAASPAASQADANPAPAPPAAAALPAAPLAPATPPPVAHTPTPVSAATAMASPAPATRQRDAGPPPVAGRQPESAGGLRVATSLSRPEPGAAAPAPGSEAAPVVIDKQPRASSPRERADAEYRKALSALGEGRTSAAAAALSAALHQDSGHAAARQALAALLIGQRRLDDAQLVLQEGLSANAAQPQLALRLAHIQVERGDLAGAADTLRRSAAAAAGNAEYRALHAGVLQRLGQHRAAVEEYQAALRIAPLNGVWWMGLGLSLEPEGRAAEARDAFLRARASGGLSDELDRYVEQKLRQSQP